MKQALASEDKGFDRSLTFTRYMSLGKSWDSGSQLPFPYSEHAEPDQ